MLATGLSVFQHSNDTFWSLMYERPDLYVYVTDDMVSWLGFGGDSKHQRPLEGPHSQSVAAEGRG